VSQVNMESVLCGYLQRHHTGRKNAASSKTLEAVFHIKGADIRKMVNTLRCAGIPVCSDTAGYYYAGTQEEVNTTIAQLNSRITKIANAKNGLLASTEMFRTPAIDIQINLIVKEG
jgi:biotin operon repressor